MKTYKAAIHIEFDAEDMQYAANILSNLLEDFEYAMNNLGGLDDGKARNGAYVYLDDDKSSVITEELEYKGD